MTEAIDYFSKGHPLARLRSRYAWRAREAMLERFMSKLQPTRDSQVLDLGVTPDTTLPESNHFEQRYPWPENLTAASIEPVEALRQNFPRIRFIQIPTGPLPFKDREFSKCFCSAVIEHVGNTENQIEFMREIARISDSFFITTPNRWFPLEFHTITPLIHWLPQSWHQSILRLFGQKFWSKTENLNLLGKAELQDICALACPDFDVSIEGVNLFGWPSNLVAWGKRR
jgi:SAM-dependent methyltransferase